MKTIAILLATLLALAGCGTSTVEGQPSAVASVPVATVASPTTSANDDSCSVQNAPTGSDTATIIKPYTCSYGYTPKSGELPNAACGFTNTKGLIELNAEKLAELKTHRKQVLVEGPDGPFMTYVTDDMIAIVWLNSNPRSIVVNKQQTGLINDLDEPLPYTSHLLFKDWMGGIRGLQICF